MTTKIARRLGVNAGNQHQCNPNNYAHSISVSQTKHLERSISGQTAQLCGGPAPSRAGQQRPGVIH